MKKYASLHNHSHYSNIRGLDSVISEQNLIDTAAKKGMYAVALTDHDTVSGHIKALQYYNKNYKDSDMKLILGNEVYFTEEGLTKENYDKTDKFFHFLLLAKNEKGHRQLRMLSSRAWERSFMRGVQRTPSYLSDLKDLIDNEGGQNLIGTTACLGGYLGTYYTTFGKDSLPIMEAKLQEIENILGKGNFYIEIQPSELPKTKEFNKFTIKHFWGKYPFVFTTDSHYANKEDALIHKQFLLSQSRSRDVDSFYSNNYLMTTDEIRKSFSYVTDEQFEEMRLNTIKIADDIESYDLSSNIAIPTIPVKIDKEIESALILAAQASKQMPHLTFLKNYLTSKEDQDLYYLGKIMLGYQEKISKEILPEYFERLNEELEHVWETSVKLGQPVSAYFVTMEKMIHLMWEEADSLVGVSRGSAAAFLSNYLLGITQLDPLTQVLPMPSWRLAI